MAFDHGNYDYDHRRDYGHPRKIIPYGCKGDRKHWNKCSWAFDRKQNTSSFARRNYLRTCNKHTRQLLEKELREIYEEIC